MIVSEVPPPPRLAALQRDGCVQRDMVGDDAERMYGRIEMIPSAGVGPFIDRLRAELHSSLEHKPSWTKEELNLEVEWAIVRALTRSAPVQEEQQHIDSPEQP